MQKTSMDFLTVRTPTHCQQRFVVCFVVFIMCTNSQFLYNFSMTTWISIGFLSDFYQISCCLQHFKTWISLVFGEDFGNWQQLSVCITETMSGCVKQLKCGPQMRKVIGHAETRMFRIPMSCMQRVQTVVSRKHMIDSLGTASERSHKINTLFTSTPADVIVIISYYEFACSIVFVFCINSQTPLLGVH